MAKRKSTKEQTTINKHTYKTKDRVTRTPLKTGGELISSGRVSSSCSTSDTRRLNLVTKPWLFLWYFKRQRFWQIKYILKIFSLVSILILLQFKWFCQTCSHKWFNLILNLVHVPEIVRHATCLIRTFLYNLSNPNTFTSRHWRV